MVNLPPIYGEIGDGLWHLVGAFKHFLFSIVTRSILHGYFNPLVFWYRWEYLLTSKEFNFCRASKISNEYTRIILPIDFHIFQDG